MTSIRTLNLIFPRPRRRPNWHDGLPLASFLLLFSSLCISLDVTGAVLFARPLALLLVTLSIWVWWLTTCGSTGLSRRRAAIALWLRFLMIGGFAIALAEPRTVRTSDTLTVVYAIDVSDSVGQAAVDGALSFVARQVSEKPETDEAGLVVFGQSPVVELPPGITFPFDGIVTSQVKRDGTGIPQALSLAAAMIPDENNGRVVLVSDGVSNSGDLARQLTELQARDIAVDILPVQYQYDHEVWLERLELPQQVKLEQSYEASVLLSSLKAGEGTLVLRENGRQIASSTVTFRSGRNRYSLPVTVKDSGYFEYEASIEVEDQQDNLAQNNSVAAYLYVEGEGRILLITDPEGDKREWLPLAESIRRNGKLVDVRTAYELPDSTLALEPFDCVVLVNVPADAFVPSQMQAIHDAVRDVGTGLLMTGGPDSFGPGGYNRTPVEQALPVSMDVDQQEVLPKGALVIALHTCEFADGNTWGKRIAKQAIRVLSSRDEVGVLVFADDNERWLFELTPASEFPRLITKINAAEIGDLPTFTTTMQMALEAFTRSEAASRRMVIISDGDPTAPTAPLLDAFRQNRITVSTVTISPHGEQDILTMQRIAEATGGTAHVPDSPEELPSIFVREARQLRTTLIQQATVAPEFGTPSSLTAGLDRVPLLHGYVLTSLKPGAEPLLVTQRPLTPGRERSEQGSESAQGQLQEPAPTDSTTMSTTPDPVLARWRYGLGSAAAFTSDLTARWGRDWVSWEHFDAFVAHLLTALSRSRNPGSLRLWVEEKEGRAALLVEDFAANSRFLEVSASALGPDGLLSTTPLQQTGPNRYQAEVPLTGQGRYQFVVRGTDEANTETVTGGLIIPYSREYLRFRSAPVTLEQIRKQTGGQVLTTSTPTHQVFGDRIPKTATHPIIDWLLIALAVFVPIDVAARRIDIDRELLLNFILRGRDGHKDSLTLETLLARKEQLWDDSARPISLTEQERPRQFPARNHKATNSLAAETTSKLSSQDESTPATSPSKDVPTDSADTTLARLLAIKRMNHEDMEDSDQQQNE